MSRSSTTRAAPCPCNARLKAEAEGLGAAPEDAPLIEEIEKRHIAFEGAQKSHENVRHHGIFIGAACAIAAVPAAIMNRMVALPFLLVAFATTVVSIIYRRRMERAHVAEQEALAAAGAPPTPRGRVWGGSTPPTSPMPLSPGSRTSGMRALGDNRFPAFSTSPS